MDIVSEPRSSVPTPQRPDDIRIKIKYRMANVASSGSNTIAQAIAINMIN